ncbi:hypothetical protein ACI2S3_03405 [Ralstonia nicotianae]|uniref:hypothetical protein n=1 Tax=Ralstonia pseudosolanacearum TaxID=1310165 RepID=UPI000CE53D81|nr:hypothetical protein [Ralstonia pseudosolanacearum]MCF1441061.1 hypothetical protein [Ralstonia solanacearum]BCL91155.1 hypothetical protein MAFF211479_08560 [Ralstonia solanacearum]BCL98470.1 hypothetical protein MAFF211491_29220 [Ralstonia solanacearum]BCM13912.1 hypothetical protein MAFF241648_31020 [Ralstonia solanacearum]BCN03718.1 hypothetical protein RPSB_08550 [Ralstonia solanacearum]
MTRTTEYRGYQIHMELVGASKDMFDLWFCIEGPIQPPGITAIGKRIKVHGGPFSRRWAHLIGELAGRAAIDVILGVEDEPPATDEW